MTRTGGPALRRILAAVNLPSQTLIRPSRELFPNAIAASVSTDLAKPAEPRG